MEFITKIQKLHYKLYKDLAVNLKIYLEIFLKYSSIFNIQFFAIQYRHTQSLHRLPFSCEELMTLNKVKHLATIKLTNWWH